MVNSNELIILIRGILWQQKYAVLSTSGPVGPHSTIVSFLPADDLHSIIFPTPSTTRKYGNLQKNHSVSIFIDNRSSNPSQLDDICGIEARGEAHELDGLDRQKYERIYRAHNPELADFSSKSSLFRISVTQYDVVTNFQNVYILKTEGLSSPQYELTGQGSHG